VDDLIKDKIEAQKEVKAKEQEEKEMVAQQVKLVYFNHLSLQAHAKVINLVLCIVIALSSC
jgi:clathrin heavy chain